jgi:hypothetical protein
MSYHYLQHQVHKARFCNQTQIFWVVIVCPFNGDENKMPHVYIKVSGVGISIDDKKSLRTL